ncbi:hypothetical protein EV175_006186, partial [Coemansia sp. RSA 1933]
MLNNISIKIGSMLVLLAAASVATAQAGWAGYTNPQAVANNIPMAQPYMRGKVLAAAPGGNYGAYEAVEPSSESTEEYSSAIYSAEPYTSEEVEPSSEVPPPTYQAVEPSSESTEACPTVEPTTVTYTETQTQTVTVTQPAPPAVTVTSVATVTVTECTTVTETATVTDTVTVTNEVAPTYETKQPYYSSTPVYVAPQPTYAAPQPTYAAPPPPAYGAAPVYKATAAPASYEPYNKKHDLHGSNLDSNPWVKPVARDAAPGAALWINMRNAKGANSGANKDVG